MEDEQYTERIDPETLEMVDIVVEKVEMINVSSPETDITVPGIKMMTTTGKEIETTVAGQEKGNTCTDLEMGTSPETDITVSEIEMMTITSPEIETTVAGQETKSAGTDLGLGPGPETEMADVTVTVPEMEIIIVHLETLGMDVTAEESTVRVLPEITDGVLQENLDISVQEMTEKEAQKKMKGSNT